MVDTIKELSDLSRQLNQESDKVNSIILRINENLANLNLGVEVWLTGEPIETGERGEVETESGWTEECIQEAILGYCRIGRAWELAVKDVLLPCSEVSLAGKRKKNLSREGEQCSC